MKEIDKKRFIFDPIDIKTCYGITFISSFYIYERYSYYFDVVEIIPGGMDNLKNTIILRKL